MSKRSPETGSPKLLPGRRLLLISLYVAIVAIWGTTWYGMKVSVESFPPLTAAGLRFTLAFPLLAVAVVVVPGWHFLPPRGTRWLVPVLTVSYVAVPYALINWGEQRTSSGLAALLFASVTVLLVLISVLLGTVRVSAVQWSGIAVGLGLLVVVLLQAGSSLGAQDGWGPAAIFAAAMLHALSYALIARFARAAPVISLEVLPIGLGGVLLLLAGLATHPGGLGDGSVRSWAAVGYLAVVASVIGFAIYVFLLQRVSPVVLSFVFVFFPVVALGLSAWLERLRITPLMVLGVAGALLAFAVVTAGGAGSARNHRAEV
jgi:putative membrane protein PagO